MMVHKSCINGQWSKTAFSLIELLFVIVTLVLLVGFVIPGLIRGKSKKERTDCTNNLKQIGLSFRMWSGDSRDRYPMKEEGKLGGSLEAVGEGEVFRHFECMSNELNTPFVLTCPSDERIPGTNFTQLSNTNLSYFVGVDAEEVYPQVFLSGDRNLIINGSVASGLVAIQSNSIMTWSNTMHRRKGNISLGDGSVHWVDDTGLQKLVRAMGPETNRLAIP